MSGENVNVGQSSDQNSEAWDNFNNFAGERNINDKTGKERTFSEFDLYPRLPGESPQDYGARLKDMHEKTAKYLAEQEASKAITDANGMRTDSYLKSDSGKRELDAEASYNRVADKLERAVQEGRMNAEHANKLLERKLNSSIKEIDSIRQGFEDSKTVGTEEEQKSYQEWLRNRDTSKSDSAKQENTSTEQPKDNKEPENTKTSVNTEKEPGSSKENNPDISEMIELVKANLIEEIENAIRANYEKTLAEARAKVEAAFNSVSVPKFNKAPTPIIPEVKKKGHTEAMVFSSINENIKRQGEVSGQGEAPQSLENASKEALQAELDRIHRKKAEIEAKRAEIMGPDAVVNLIKDNGGKIGGQEGVDILTINGPNRADDYSNWWKNVLDEDGKKTVRRILKEAKFSNTPLNQDFLDWLAQHDREDKWVKNADEWLKNHPTAA